MLSHTGFTMLLVLPVLSTFVETSRSDCMKMIFLVASKGTYSLKVLSTAKVKKSKLSSLHLRWDNIEGANPNIQPGFFTWFCTHKVETMKSTMLQPVREEAGYDVHHRLSQRMQAKQ